METLNPYKVSNMEATYEDEIDDEIDEFEYLESKTPEDIIEYFFESLLPDDKEIATHIKVKGGEFYYIIRDNIYHDDEYIESYENVLKIWERYTFLKKNNHEIFPIGTPKEYLYAKDKLLYKHRNSIENKIPVVDHISVIQNNGTIGHLEIDNINNTVNNTVNHTYRTEIITVHQNLENIEFGIRQFNSCLFLVFNNDLPWLKNTKDQRIKIMKQSMKYNYKTDGVSLNRDDDVESENYIILKSASYLVYDKKGNLQKETLLQLGQNNKEEFMIPEDKSNYIRDKKNEGYFVIVVNEKGKSIDMPQPIIEPQINYKLDMSLLVDLSPTEIVNNGNIVRIDKFEETINSFWKLCAYHDYEHCFSLKKLFELFRNPEHSKSVAVLKFALEIGKCRGGLLST